MSIPRGGFGIPFPSYLLIRRGGDHPVGLEASASCAVFAYYDTTFPSHNSTLLAAFIDNVTTQAVEQHIVRGLEKVLSPITVSSLSDVETAAIAYKLPSAKRQRAS